MSLFGRKERKRIDNLMQLLRFREEMIESTLDRLLEKMEKAELLRQMLIFKNQKLAEMEESKELIRNEKLRMEERVEELQQELMNERERADRYADACSASMEYGWQPVPEEEMVEAGFTRTETGWKV